MCVLAERAGPNHALMVAAITSVLIHTVLVMCVCCLNLSDSR